MSDSPAIDITEAPASTMKHDLLWAYAASGARIGSWAIVSGFVYRFSGPREFGILALLRGTIGILNYTAVGLAPAMIRTLAETRNDEQPVPVLTLAQSTSLEYQSAPRANSERIVYSSGLLIAAISVAVGMALTAIYANYFNDLHQVPVHIGQVTKLAVYGIGGGILLRLFSDVSGAVLQTRGRIALDNKLLAATEAVWVVLAFAWGSDGAFEGAVSAFAGAGVFLLVTRAIAVSKLEGAPWPPIAVVQSGVLWRLLTVGSLVLIAQLADYLYAPTDYLLIDHFLAPSALAAYAPAVQVDAGLLAIVTAMSSVLLPNAALAHVAGSSETVRSYYMRGTLASAGLLLVAATAVYFVSPWLFRLWLGSNPGTSAILPFVLVHTVIGGSSAVGRSILLAIGKFKAFTASVLIAGAVNVIASYCFVKYLNWGLRGIVLGTIVAVVGRCLVWMPWYVLRSLRPQKP